MKFLRFFLSGLLLFQGVAFASALNDVEGEEHQEAIEDLYEAGIISGYDDGSFRPDDVVNRAEMLKIVFGALDGFVDDDLSDCFVDVGDQWFAPYVCDAKEKGIVKGYGDGTFQPGKTANMVEVLKIAIEAFGLPVEDVGDQWFTPYMDFAHENNVFSKYSYWPGQDATRAEVAFLVRNLMDIKESGSYEGAVRDSGSLGCGSVWPFDPPSSFLVGGKERSVIVSLPDDYDEDDPHALVFAFHGRTSPNYVVKNYYGLERPAKGEAIFVYPAGIQKSSGYTWSDGGDAASDLRDYQLFDVMLKELSGMYCVDLDEVYVVGHSLGGWFANSLACARGDVIRGAASLGSSRSNSDCTGPTALMQWHNPNDQLASFASGLTAKNFALEQNMCSSDSVEVTPFWGNCVQYLGCTNGAPVVWCPHTNDYDGRGNYYPHNWPKGTGEEIWKFFEDLE